jgi:V/A-type H+/Na+-transporting ATPase subunit G/H
MDTEKTLLQQIRDKEQELGKKVDLARAETETIIEAARADAEALLCTADEAGKKAAEQVYWEERGKTEAAVEALKQAALQEIATVTKQGDKNLPAAVDRIVRYVTME